MTEVKEAPIRRRFKLEGGPHYASIPGHIPTNPHDTGKVLHTRDKNPIVESELPLDEIYPNKFTRLIEREPAVVTAERRAAVSKLVEAQIWEEVDRDMLEQLTDEQFLRILRQAEKALNIKVTPPLPASQEIQETNLGRNVTEDYPKAGRSGLMVWVNAAGKFQITDAKDRIKPINLKPLESKEVGKTLDDIIKARA